MPTLRQSLENMTQDEILDAAAQAIPGARLYQTLMQNPKTREQVLRMQKDINPNLPIPEIDAADKVRTEISARDDRIAALEQDARTRDIRDRASAVRSAAMSKYGLTEAEMQGVEALMVSETDPIPTYDAAARVYLADQQLATPTHSSIEAAVYEMPEHDVWGAGIGNPQALARIAAKEAAAAMNDIRRGALRPGGIATRS